MLDDGAKIRDFCGYWEILKRHQGELSLAGVDFSSLPMDQSGDSFDKAYYKEADINLKVIRETGDRLKDAAVGAAEQRALIAETKKLDQSLQGDAADAAQKKYEFTDEQLKANLQKLTNAQEAVQGVDDNLYFGLNKKQDEYTAAITLMIEGIIQNNPTDFENRLSTGAAVIKAGDTGSSGASPQLYAWHGSPGVNWPARQVKDDLQTTVIGAFATAIAAFNDANKSMDEFVTINYATLREALNIGAENTSPTGSKLSAEERDQVAQWSQYSVSNGDADCSRWATASALANKYGTRMGPDGQKEIDLPPDLQQRLMGGQPLHFPPTREDINKIITAQNAQPGWGFPGDMTLMSKQLNGFGENSGLTSAPNIAQGTSQQEVSLLVDQLTSDLQSGKFAIVNGSVTPSTDPNMNGHILSITGTTVGPNGETMYLVNDSNRRSDGVANGGTLRNPSTREELMRFLMNRTAIGVPPGYATI
ncbi:hypothetical protein [Mycobacteroides saopaulense]|uniref:hypothetical protein n=1 Tax=Mycobacteroides saopaulense TaxID=1578165 RepID=UPI0012FF964D|nr:hypothetical protein [Mycobacteroides saopaulense]